MKKVYIETLGCQMNKSDAERMLGMLEHLNYTETQNPKEADLLIINTCSIRKLSEDKAYSAIGVWGKWKKNKPDLKIAFCGCVAQQVQKDLFRRAPYVDLVLGTQRLYELPELIKRIENGERVVSCDETPCAEREEIKRVKGVNAWIPIMEGCNNFCTYCIVPYTRGRERSRTPQAIINEAKKALNEGFKEITLLGQNVDSYKSQDADGAAVNLAELLRRLNALPGQFRIRFVTSYPTDITEELINTVIELDKVCEYFHIPMQSGDSEVLKKMNRKYRTADFERTVNLIRKYFPLAGITTDVIVGFPTETEENFTETVNFIKKIGFSDLHIFPYSNRKGTVASKMFKDLPKSVKEERAKVLAEIRKKDKIDFIAQNDTLEVLIEEEKNGVFFGYSKNYIKCAFIGGCHVGEIVKARVIKPSLSASICERV